MSISLWLLVYVLWLLVLSTKYEAKCFELRTSNYQSNTINHKLNNTA